MQAEFVGQLESFVQLIGILLPDELDDETSTGTPFLQIFLLVLQLDPSGQSLFLKHTYLHRLFAQFVPNGQSLSLLHE